MAGAGGASGAIIAKSRAIYGRRLTSEDYNNLVHKGSINGVVAYLKDTERYREVFKNVNETQIHRGQVEQMLSKSVYELFFRLCGFMAADKNSFCYYFIKETEIKQIISALMYIKAGSEDGYLLEMPAYLMGKLSFDMMRLSKAQNYGEILDVLIGTPYYKVLKPVLISGGDLEECASTLYAWFIKWAFKAIEQDYGGEEARALKEIFLRQSDLFNITMCYRKRSLFDEDAQTIKKSLRDTYYRVKPSVIDEILAQPDADKQLLSLLKKLYFKNNIECDPENLEISVRRYNYNYCKKQLVFTQNGTMALYSLIGLCEVECTNIRKIVESARYNRSPAETEQLLVF